MEKKTFLSRVKTQYIEAFENLKGTSNLPGDLVLLTEDRFKAAMEYLRDNYLTDEPCSKSGCQQFTDDVKREWFEKSFSFGLSVCLLKPGTNEIIAIQIIDTESKHERYAVDGISDEALRQSNKMHNQLVEGYDMFEEFGVDEAIRFGDLSVAKLYRNQGIATKLIAFCNRVLSHLDNKPLYAKVHCASQYSRKVFEQNDFHIVNSIRYDEYFNDGKLVYPNMGEHTSMDFFIKRIS